MYVLILSLATALLLGAFVQSLRIDLARINRESAERATLRLHEDGFTFLTVDTLTRSASAERVYPEAPQPQDMWRYRWGLFTVLGVRTSFDNNDLVSARLYGMLPQNGSPALVLPQAHGSAYATGDVRIEGPIMATSLRAYTGREFSAEGAPDISRRMQKPPARISTATPRWGTIDRAISANGSTAATTANFLERASYLGDPVLVEGERIVLSRGDSLIGHVLLRASTSIEVQPGAVVQGALLEAPQVMILPGAEVELQARASERIEVGEGARLRYPSSLLLVTDGTPDTARIRLRPGSRVMGSVLTSHRRATAISVLTLDAGSTVVGQVSAAGYADVRGQIDGELRANKLYVETPGVRRTGIMWGGQIQPSRRDSAMVLSNVTFVGARAVADLPGTFPHLVKRLP